MLVESKASLYVYENGMTRGYFYAVDGAALRQLVHKKYWAKSGENRLMYNTGYRAQLWADVKCSSTEFASLERLRYVNNDLEKYFRAYNECVGAKESVAVGRGGVKETLHFSVQAGATYGTLSSTQNGWTGYEPTFKGVAGFRLGIAAEFTLPF